MPRRESGIEGFQGVGGPVLFRGNWKAGLALFLGLGALVLLAMYPSLRVKASPELNQGASSAGMPWFTLAGGDGGFANPHGNYGTNTGYCATCHFNHEAVSGRLLREAAAEQVCYLCHDETGAGSIYPVEAEFTGAVSRHPVPDTVNCQSCHDPHTDAWPRSLKATSPGGVTYNSGNEFCWACHGGDSELPGPAGDHQTSYPADGTGHDHATLTPPSGTEIKCLACHREHGSDQVKLLQRDPNRDDTPIAGNDQGFCYECHGGPLNATADNAWDGSVVNDAYGHAGTCLTCHDPHGTEFAGYLDGEYETSYSATRTTPFNAADFEQCFSCHTGYEIEIMAPDASGQQFFNGSSFSGNGGTDRMNLHEFHLKLGEGNAAGVSGRGNALCKECHRPHGAVAWENAAQSAQVGFPAATVAAYSDPGGEPVFERNPAGVTAGGGCNLSCHGADHVIGAPSGGEIDSRYDRTGVGGSSLEILDSLKSLEAVVSEPDPIPAAPDPAGNEEETSAPADGSPTEPPDGPTGDTSAPSPDAGAAPASTPSVPPEEAEE